MGMLLDIPLLGYNLKPEVNIRHHSALLGDITMVLVLAIQNELLASIMTQLLLDQSQPSEAKFQFHHEHMLQSL